MAEKSTNFGVFGLSRFGQRIAESLFAVGASVLVVDEDDRIIKRMAPLATRAIAANVTDWDVMERFGFFGVDTAIIGMRSSFDVAVLLVNHLKRHTNVREIIAQADTDEKAEALSLLGAHIVVFPERDTADELFHRLTRPNLKDLITLSEGVEIVELPIPASFDGRTLIDLRLRNRFEVQVIGLKHNSLSGATVETNIAPSPTQPLRKGDSMLLLGKTEHLRRMEKEILE